jgi:hypothetical protein
MLMAKSMGMESIDGRMAERILETGAMESSMGRGE